MEKKELIEAIYALCAGKGTHLRQKDLPAALGDIPGKEIEEALSELLEQGRLAKSNKGRIVTPETLGLTVGRVTATATGYAFIKWQEGKDALLTDDDTGCALHGDTVLARITKERDGRYTAYVDRVLAHMNASVTGVYVQEREGGFIEPTDRRIHARFAVSAQHTKGAQEGDLVVARVLAWSEDGDHEARIEDVLGGQDDHAAQLRAIIHEKGLSEEFPQEALDAARAVRQRVNGTDRDGREDLRKQPCVTIDGATAKDFDDAVYAEEIPGGWRLYVHIADATHYVRKGSPLDREAYDRATSVYLLDTVLPMLPEELSNGICSLNPDVDRLAFSCVMDISAHDGEVTDYRLARTVIRSSGRLVYDDVTAMLEGDETAREKLTAHLPMLERLQRLTDALSARRAQRGAVDFELPEPDIRLDAQGAPVSVEAAKRGIANRMIEECMLLANEMVAQYAVNLDLPFLYRVHEEPEPDKLRTFAALATNLGYSLKVGKKGVHPKHLRELLQRLEGQPEEAMLSGLMLRSLQRARYDTRALGHYGLSLRDYCHFTSPIRRYPDLFIHRVLGMQLAGELTDERLAALSAAAPEAAEHASAKERAAAEAEMDVDDWKRAEYMEKHVGEAFDGLISGVSGFGIFVTLPNTVTGMIPLRAMEDDHYIFHEEQYVITGRRSKQSYRLGDRIQVVCAAVDVRQRKIEFLPKKMWEDRG